MTEKILILDFGSQYTQLIARTVREANVYCEITPYNKEIEFSPQLKGVILSGSPFSVNDENALQLNVKDINEKIPVPQSVRKILSKIKLSTSMEPDFENLKQFLLSR